MSTENARNGLAIRARRAQEGHGALIAQIPDLRQKTASTALGKPVDVRAISRALSFHLVLGVGLGLLVGAALPVVFGMAGRPNPPVAQEPPAWLDNSGSKNQPQNRAAGLVASVPERGSATGSNNRGAAGSNGTALRTTAPTWLSPLSAPIDTFFLSQTLTDTTVPLSDPIATVRLPQPLTDTTVPLSARIDTVRLPQTRTDTTVPPQSPTAPSRDTDARYDDGSGNPFRTPAARRNTSNDDFSSMWPSAASRLRPSDATSPTPISRIPEPGVASKSTTTVPPGRDSYGPATSSTH